MIDRTEKLKSRKKRKRKNNVSSQLNGHFNFALHPSSSPSLLSPSMQNNSNSALDDYLQQQLFSSTDTLCPSGN